MYMYVLRQKERGGNMKNIIGIDPGADGSAVLIRTDNSVDILRFKKCTEKDIVDALFEWVDDGDLTHLTFCYLEKVHAMPKQGVSSTFKFGKSFGFLIGVLTALGIPYEFVTPNAWQKQLGCQSKGDKNVTKAKAQQLFPAEKIVHGNADALLIAEYGRRIHNNAG